MGPGVTASLLLAFNLFDENSVLCKTKKGGKLKGWEFTPNENLHMAQGWTKASHV